MPGVSKALAASSSVAGDGGDAESPSIVMPPSGPRIEAMSAASRAPGFGATLP